MPYGLRSLQTEYALLDDEVVQIVLLREFIAESQTVVEKPEADHDVTLVVGLFKGYGQFVVMVPDFVFFSPYGVQVSSKEAV